MILHTVVGSPRGRQVEAVIYHLGLDLEIRIHNLFNGELRSAEYLAVNPNAKVPALVDGDFKLWEAAAITQYLADKAGNEALFPHNARIRADIARWQIWESTHFNEAFGSLTFETLVKAKYNLGPPDRARVETASQNLARFAPVLEEHLRGRRYLVEDRLTIADFSVASCEPYVGHVPFDFGPYPNIRAYFERIRATEAWARACRSPSARPLAA